MAKLIKVTKANAGPRDNVGGALNNALVTVQDHNKVVDAVNLLYDNDAAGGMTITEIVTASSTSTTQAGFANLQAGDFVVGKLGSDLGNMAVVATAATCPFAPVSAALYMVIRPV